jgi:hypothetical protein
VNKYWGVQPTTEWPCAFRIVFQSLHVIRQLLMHTSCQSEQEAVAPSVEITCHASWSVVCTAALPFEECQGRCQEGSFGPHKIWSPAARELVSQVDNYRQHLSPVSIFQTNSTPISLCKCSKCESATMISEAAHFFSRSSRRTVFCCFLDNHLQHWVPFRFSGPMQCR